MSFLEGRGSKKSRASAEEVRLRTQYVDPSLHFLNWVNQLGFEKSFLGRLAYYLDRKFDLRRVLLFFLFALALSLLMFSDFQTIGHFSVGDVAKTDIRSPMNVTIVDQAATEEKRLAAEKSQPVLFDYQYDAYDPVYNRIYKAFRIMRIRVDQTYWPRSDFARAMKVRKFMRFKPEFMNALQVKVPTHIFEWLVEQRFNVEIENILIRVVSQWANEKIADIVDPTLRNSDRQVIIRELTPNGNGHEMLMKMDAIKNMQDMTQFPLDGVRGFAELNEQSRYNVTLLAHSLLLPNLTLNKQDFEERQKKAWDSVLPVQISIKKNQVVVSKGTTIDPVHLSILNAIRSKEAARRVDFLALFSALLFVLLTITFISFLRRYSRDKIKIESKDILIMGVVTVLVVILARLFLYVMDASLADRFSKIPDFAFQVAAPAVAGPMLVGLLVNSTEIVWIFTVFLSTVLAVMLDLNLGVFLVTLISGIAAAQGVFGCKKRNDIYMAGLRTGLVGALSSLLIFTMQEMANKHVFWGAGICGAAGFCGGVLSSFVAMTFLPLLESLFNVTTDIKLLELGNLNHPIMQELMMKAPGTYHHAMNVGNMVDAAAKEIGANPLLAKVMAFYHDIGKMEHAQYFVENQRPGHNPHDQVSPHMSKTILVAHVKDGAEMAIAHKLGKPIVDGILQHHGTTLISYFYNRALEDQNENTTGTVEESDFRYPGPKPQFKEAALVMLADGIEATARALDEPTQSRLNSIVENIIESRFMDGQLDECNLSIRDLATIKDTFKQILLAMYHQRMEYPHMRDGKLIAVKQQNELVADGVTMKKRSR